MTPSSCRIGVRLVFLALGSAASAAIPLSALGAPPASTEVTPPQMIDAFEGTFGAHAGQRRNHIKGTCAAGEFVGTADAAALSRSALFSGKAVPVVARFSLGGGSPEVPDAAPAPRGMALELHLPGGALQHITMINVPIFAAASPASFRDAIVAAKPDPKTGQPDPEKLKTYAASHPDAMALSELASHHTPTANYYQTTYFSIHTFKFVDAKGTEHPVKWRFVPRDGTKELTAAEMKAAPHDFLEKNLIERTRTGPAVWDMIVYVGEPGDPQDNQTQAWPETRKHFTAGTLTIRRATPQQKGMACEPINFDPLIMADGIAPTNDPILLFRSPAYAVSYAKRLSGQ
jgi:catalase